MRHALLTLTATLLLAACGVLTDQEPIADAGPNQTVDVGTQASIDASNSFAVAGRTITYTWTLLSAPLGSTATLGGGTGVGVTITPDLPGDYVIQLVVNDGFSDSDPDTVTIHAVAVDQSPIADAGPDAVVTVGAAATLDGTASSDPEAGAITYLWTIEAAPLGSTATLSSATAVQPTLTPDVQGTWVLSLTVNDGNSSSTADRVLLTTVWNLNLSNTAAAIYTNSDSTALPVNVQSIDAEGTSPDLFLRVKATGIPDYQHTLTAADVNFLDNVQPDSKMQNGSGTTLIAGTVLNLGANVGYKVIDACFASTQGGGWFPPGPTCPSDQAHDIYIPLSPQPATQTCYTQVNTIGVYRNGVAMFNWSDAQTFNNAGVWHQLAAKFEVKDLDLCASHANQSGNYHHHLTPNCLSEQLGDTGTGHSPIYGYAADGYPIYGPWYSNGVKAQSCWKTRDYDTPSPQTGCGTAKKRTCVLDDNTDPTAGSSPAASAGPDTDAVEISDGGDPYTVASGYYYEDYYFDATCAAAGNEFLDEHNGHTHGTLGYHYHQTDGFPYNAGPVYAGELASNAVQTCSAVPAAVAQPSGKPGATKPKPPIN